MSYYNEFNDPQDNSYIYDDKNIILQKALQKNSVCDMKDMVFDCLPFEMSKNIYIKKLDISESCVVSLNNLPPNLEDLTAINNDIQELDENILPKSLRAINVKNNSITKINLKNCTNLIKILCENNPIHTLLLPNTLRACTISSQTLDLTDFEKMDDLFVLRITQSIITNLAPLTQNVRQLLIVNSQILCDIPKFGSNLQRLSLVKCNLNSTFNFPENLSILTLSDNNLTGTFIIPSSVIDLDISDNNILSLENVHSNLHKLNISNNININISSEQLLILRLNECSLINDNTNINIMDYNNSSNSNSNSNSSIAYNFHKLRMFSEQQKRQQDIREMMMRHKSLSSHRKIETFIPSTSNKIIINKFCSV